MKKDQLELITRMAALRAYVENAFKDATGGWATHRDRIIRMIDEAMK